MPLRTLSRYLLRQNMFYMLTVLAAGTALYLLSDLFDRLDDFLEAGLGLGTMAWYFVVKTPLILSQILPAVFLVAAVIQLCLMARGRELLALRSGGVSFGALARFFVVHAVLWSLVQLAFAQGIGVFGEQAASAIWAEQVRDRQLENRELYNVWFKEGDAVVRMQTVRPTKSQALNVTVFELTPDRGAMTRMITAATAETVPGRWVLRKARILDPATFAVNEVPEVVLPLTQDLRSFLAIDPDTDPASLSMAKLSAVIQRLEASGSNVERLRTAWHMKWSYAFSILAMGLIALALVTLWENIYLNIALSLGVTFAYYVVFMLGVTAGQKGLLHPVVGAWLANILFCAVAGGRLAWVVRPSAARR